MLTTGTADGDDEVDPHAELDRMTPEQRAALRAMIQKAREEAASITEDAADQS
jgi:hypothetical protein